MPLSSNGLWLAEITIPASALMLLTRKAMAGVGIGPTRYASAPIETTPLVRALSSI